MAEMDENIRVSLNLEVKDPNVDLDSLDKLTKYFDEIYKASVRVNEAMKKALDMGEVNPDTLKVYREQVDSIKHAFEEVKKIKSDAIQNAYDSFDVGGTTNISVLSDAVDKLNMKFEETTDKLKEAETGFKRLQTNAKITSAAPNLTSSTDTQKQIEQVAQATNKMASNTSKTVSSSAKACANVANKALNTIGSTGEKVFTKIGKASLATFKTIASGMTSALVHPVSSLKNLESVLLKPFKSLNSLLPQVSMGIRGVTSGLLALGGVAGLIMLGKQAVSTSSQLEEIQNVVDVVFNGMSNDIENFSTTLASAFGESELQAKKFTSTFGSMFSSVGVTSDKILVMSENMSALAGDMASFYNLPIEQAFEKIQSGLAGESEPLRQLGINMNQTAIEAWAMTQGITTSFNKLSTSEQTILRYNYLLAMTANAHGDFTRTQLSWANSCRQIALNVQTIFAALGNIVKAALTPVLTMINYVTSALAKLLTLVGARFKSTTQTASSGMSGLNSQISDASDGLGKVADSATKAGKAAEAAGKKAKLGLASFDQLNNLSSQTSDAGSSGSSGAGGGAGAGAGAGMDINPNSYIEGIEWTDDNPLTKWMNKFYETLTDGRYAAAGDMCAKAITTGLKKVENALDSKSLYTKIDNTNMALSNFLRGLVSDQNMWTQLGNTIGSGINIIAFSINNLYDNLTANNVLSSIGSGIASTINASLEKTDWSGVGSALVTGIRSGIDVAFYAIMNIDFSSLGTALKNGCSGAISRVFGNGGAAEIGGIISGVINGAMNTVIAWLGDGTVFTKLGEGIKNAINTAINNIDADSLGNALTAIFRSAFNLLSELRGIDFKELGRKIVSAINTSLENGSAQDFVESAVGLVADIAGALLTALSEIDWGSVISVIASSLGSAVKDNPNLAGVGLLIVSGLGISKALKAIDFAKLLEPLMSNVSGLSSALGSLGGAEALAPLAAEAGTATEAVGGLSAGLGGLLGTIGIVAAAVAAFIGTFAYLWETSETFRDSIQGIVNTVSENLEPVFADMKESLSEIGSALLSLWDIIANVLEPFMVGIVATLGTIFQGIMKVVGGILDIVAGILTLNPDKIWEGITKIATGLLDVLTSALVGAQALLDNIWAKIGEFVTNTVSKLADFFSNVKNSVASFITTIISNIVSFISNIWSSITSFVTNILSSIGSMLVSLVSKFADGMANIKAKVSEGISAVVSFFSGLPASVSSIVSNFVSSVGNWFSAVPSKIKEAFGDVAEIGTFLVQGLWNGINDAKDWILDKVKGFGKGILDGLKDFFGIHSPSRVMRDQIGIFLGQGIGVGIEESAKYAVASATQMGSDVMDAVSDSIDPDAVKLADMKLSLADVYKTDNLDTVLQHYNTQMDSLVAKAQAFRDAMNEVSGKYSLDTLKVLLGDYRKVNSGDDIAPQRVVIAGQERVVTVSGMSEGVSANEVMSIVNDNARRF